MLLRHCSDLNPVTHVYLMLLFCNLYMVKCNLNTTCSYYTTTNAQVERKLPGVGFHRNLETYISVTSQEDLSACRILMKDIFPSGAFADPDQLKFMEELGGAANFIPQFVNTEAPEHISPKIHAFFFLELIHNIEGNWVVNISVPVHLRYHRAKSGSVYSLEETVTFPHPSVYLTCEEELPETCLMISQLEPCHPGKVQHCDWLPVTTFSTSIWVEATVPVGNADLLDTVLLTTTAITCAAVLLLLASLFRKPEDSCTNVS